MPATATLPKQPELPFPGIDCFRIVAAYAVVVLHFWHSLGGPRDLSWLVRVRDCALPFFILAMVFFLTRGLRKRPERDYGEFAARRFLRLGLPFLAWSALYGLFVQLLPWLQWPRFTLVGSLLGGSHLWFLAFMVLVSLALFPGLRALARRGWLNHWLALACLLAAIIWLVWLQKPLNRWSLQLIRETSWSFPKLCIRYLSYVPLGISLAIWTDPIRRWMSFPLVWIAVLLFGAGGMYVHTIHGPVITARAVYSVSLVLLLLGPFPRGASAVLRPWIEQTYAVYAMHIMFLAFARYFLLQTEAPVTLGLVLGGSLVILLVAMVVSLLLARVPGVRWILPQVPVRSALTGRAETADRILAS